MCHIDSFVFAFTSYGILSPFFFSSQRYSFIDFVLSILCFYQWIRPLFWPVGFDNFDPIINKQRPIQELDENSIRMNSYIEHLFIVFYSVYFHY